MNKAELLSKLQAYRTEGTGRARVMLEGLANLQKEIARVRLENKCERTRRRWNSMDTHVAELVQLLNYIEGELDKITRDESFLAETAANGARPQTGENSG